MTAVDVAIKQEADEKSTVPNGFQSMPRPPLDLRSQGQYVGPTPDVGPDGNIPSFPPQSAQPQQPLTSQNPNGLAVNGNGNTLSNHQQWVQQQAGSPTSTMAAASEPPTPVQPGQSEPEGRRSSFPTQAKNTMHLDASLHHLKGYAGIQKPPQLQSKVAIPIRRPDGPTITPPSGPRSRAIVLQPLAKPGRKTIESSDLDDQKSKRQEQNRKSQRRHRDKKTKREEYLEFNMQLHDQSLKDLVGNHNNQRAAWEAERAEFRQQRANLEMRLRQAEHALATATRPGPFMPRDSITDNTNMAAGTPAQYAMPGQSPYGKPQIAHMPPPEHHAYETDFTNTFARTVSSNITSSNDLGLSGLGADDHCGFCKLEPGSYCQCKQNDVVEPEPQPRPGGCVRCIADPERAQACRQLATSALYPRFRPLHSTDDNNDDNRNSLTSASDSLSMKRSDSPFGRISCEQLMDRATDTSHQVSWTSVAETLGKQIHAHPASNGRYEVEEHEAARALQSLSTHSPKMERSKR